MSPRVVVSFATPPRSSSTTYSPSPTQFAFTPRTTVKARRAWERKPATPFAPRNESQKIWKRPAAHVSSMNGVNETGALQSCEARAAKRMRITKDTHGVSDGVSTSWAEDELEAKHKLPKASEAQRTPIVLERSLSGNPPGTNDPSHQITGCNQDSQELLQRELSLMGEYTCGDDTSGADSASETATPPSSIDAMPYVEQPAGKQSEMGPGPVVEDKSLDEEATAQLQLASQVDGEAKEDCQSVLLDRLADDAFQNADQSRFEHVEGLVTKLGQEDKPAQLADSPASSSRPGQDSIEQIQEPYSGADMTDPVKVDCQQVAQSPPAHALPGHGEDADFLHAFLSRTKAQKEARAASPQKDSSVGSPMTRSRAALTSLSTNSASPRRPKRTRKGQLDVEGHDELSASPYTQATESAPTSPPRRSGRKKLARPQKPPAVNPSTIPVRRANGTEFVFLQRTEPQQIALATRSNTRHNKGEAVMPKYKLQALSEAQRSPSKSPKKREGRGVSFKEEPCFFEAHPEGQDEEEAAGKADDKPKARNVRRLRTSNGTPARKKVMTESAIELDTPKPRSRRKSQR